MMNNPNYLELLKFLKHSYAPSAWLGHLEFAMFLVNKYKPDTIVELGVDYAHSSFALASEGQGTVYAIDCFEGDVHTGFRDTFSVVQATYRKLVEEKKLPKENIQFIKGYFENVAKTFDKKINLLHIDGLHTYEAVKQDFETWIDKVDPDGVIIMHDITAFAPTVGKYFSEIPLPKTSVPHSAGLGIVSKNPKIIEEINREWISKLRRIDNTMVHIDYPQNLICL